MNELIALVTKNLNVDQNQAEGGVGAIFNLVKQNLESGDFSKLSAVLPGVEQLINKAPATDAGLGGLVGGALSMLGTSNSQLRGIAQLAGAFKTLGIDMNTAMKFAPLVTNFVQSKGGETCKQLLEKALGGK